MSTEEENNITTIDNKIYNFDWLKNDLLYSMTPLLNVSTSNDYRKIPIYPTKEDLDFDPEPTALRINNVNCPYKNCEEYLDTFFRLVRDDFMSVVRNSFRYLHDNENNHLFNKYKVTQGKNISYYSNVHMQHVYNIDNNIKSSVLFFQFDSPNRAVNIDYENSNKFKNGALVFLSMNKFKTYVLGIVVQSYYINRGIVYIDVVDYKKVKQWHKIDLLEIATFYEPYRYIMAVLQDMNETNFPMKEFIVYSRKTISHPRYLANNSIYKINGIVFDILKHDQWPSAEILKMDINQYEAFKGALIKEFTLIQGPPGTGKSCIALQIIRSIIENIYYTKKLTNPILVVCMTNHTLDQFLEGVWKITKNISRFGGGTKSEILINHIAKLESPHTKECCAELIQNEVQRNADVLKKNINLHALNIMEVKCNCGILDLSCLLHVLTVNGYNSWFQDSYDLLTWLLFNIPHVDGVNPIDFIKTNKLLSDKLYCISLDEIEIYCGTVQDQLSGLNLEDEINLSKKTHLTHSLKIMKTVKDYIMDHLKLYESKSFVEFNNAMDRDSLEISNRWLLYYNWVNLFITMESKLIDDIQYSVIQCEKSVSKFNSIRYLDLVKDKYVIGMTTCAAAKHRCLLKNLKCPIGKYNFFVLSFQYYYYYYYPWQFGPLGNL